MHLRDVEQGAVYCTSQTGPYEILNGFCMRTSDKQYR